MIALALLAAPAGLLAQQSGGIDPAQLPPEARELIVELQQVQSGLGSIQEKALADPALQQARSALNAQIQVAMTQADPAVPERMERLQTLMGEAQAAQAEQDEARMAEIVAEAREIEQQLQKAQTEAIQRPEIAPQLRGFQAKLLEKMVEVDPTAQTMIERLQELDARLGEIASDTP